MLKALRFDILRNVQVGTRHPVPLAEKPVRVALLLNEAAFMAEQLMVHHQTVFLDDRHHDWDWSDASGAGHFRYFSHAAGPGEVVDVVVAYEVDRHYERPHRFDMMTGKPLVGVAAPEVPAVTCVKCNDTGETDSGGVQPWGEGINISCDCEKAAAPL